MKKILLLIIISIQIPGLLYAQDDTKIFRHGQLDNGLTYYVRHTTMQPGKADFYLVQNVGALMEEDNQNGLAHFLEHTILRVIPNKESGSFTYSTIIHPRFSGIFSTLLNNALTRKFA